MISHKNTANKIQIISLLSLLLLVFYSSTLSAQVSVDGIWYAKSFDGEITNRIVIKGKSVVYESYESYNVDKPYWKESQKMQVDEYKTTANGIIIAKFVNNTYYGGEFTINSSGDELMVFRMNDGASDLKNLQQKLDAYPLKQFFAKQYYTKKRLEEIQNYPSLDEIKKEDVVTLINYMKAGEKNLGEYKSSDRLISRIGRSMLDLKLIELGYDPHKPTENGYYMKRFAEEADVKKLLENMSFFVLY